MCVCVCGGGCVRNFLPVVWLAGPGELRNLGGVIILKIFVKYT